MTDNSTIAALGGSTPFTIGLFEAFRNAADRLPRMDIRLHGRDPEGLRLVSGFCQHLMKPFGWTVTGSNDMSRCLKDAGIVVHQIRYGELDGRREDEELCARFGLSPDETFGLGGLQASLRLSRMIRPVGETMANAAPDAWVVNLTNPLSVSTTFLAKEFGRKNCLGVCELPVQTAHGVAELLDVPFDALDWDYTGLNHRGFLHSLSIGGRDVTNELADKWPKDGYLCIKSGWLRDLQAVPLKYYRVLTEDLAVSPPGRATQLIEMKRAILAELRLGKNSLPRNLQDRRMPWYGLGVLPIIDALNRHSPREVVTTLHDPADGISYERKIRLDADGLDLLPASEPPQKVRELVDKFARQEKATIAAAFSPSRKTIREALELDPLVPANLVDACTSELAARWIRS